MLCLSLLFLFIAWVVGSVMTDNIQTTLSAIILYTINVLMGIDSAACYIQLKLLQLRTFKSLRKEKRVTT
jgi:hypothetical protein